LKFSVKISNHVLVGVGCQSAKKTFLKIVSILNPLVFYMILEQINRK